MKRFHVHVAVEDLSASIRFYSALFGSDPSVTEADYAKWMLDDPRVNFAISSRGRNGGVNHLGFQVDSAEELVDMKSQLQAADAALVEETAIECCYARSDKYWITDPSGIAWETFHSLGRVPVYGEDVAGKPANDCCTSMAASEESGRESSCAPSESKSKSACCQ
jgi:catechol 2,3-dioxygenase-like lactoylglutathione lyase family enzyme